MDLRQVPIIEIKGIGAKTASLLHKVNVQSVHDLLWYVPRTYLSYPPVTPIRDVKEGDTVAVRGIVNNDLSEKKGRVLVTAFSVRDDTGSIQMVFFRQSYLKSVFVPGRRYIFYGTVKRFGYTLKMEMPEYLRDEQYEEKIKSLQPVYPLTKGLSSRLIQKSVQEVFNNFFPLKDPYDEEMLKKNNLMALSDAFRNIHFPTDEEHFLAARRRLAFDEFVTFLQNINEAKKDNTALPSNFIIRDFDICDRFEKALPFALTNAQKECFGHIKKDLGSEYAMRRLLQGDVGSGKTLVAFMAMAAVANAGFQCALMAPTEVLATQHFQALCRENEEYKLGLRPVLLTGSVTAANKRKIVEALKNGEYDCVIGTHAVFQDKVEFKNLALVITDEQHRFGVKQRESLSGKGDSPHILVMSATPIPRTLTLTLYADLQVSVMRELPNMRLPIKSCIIDASLRGNAFNFIEKEVKAGHQAYIICPMVEENEDSSLENVTSYPERLKERFGDSIRYDILHGRMKQADKNRVMEDFAAGKTDVLISTTVVEVGVDVPNATVILIENAERFGLAQLHQLRGRVGRGDAQSYCVFLDGKGQCENNERLKVLKDSNDGFVIAEEDLRLRGPGDLDGIRQSGAMNFMIADIIRDYDILMLAKVYTDNG